MTTSSPPHDALRFAQNWVEVAEQSQRILSEFLARRANDAMHTPLQNLPPQLFDPMNVTGAFMDMYSQLLKDPGKLVEKQVELWQQYLGLWQHTTLKFLGEESVAFADDTSRDRRFKDPAWQENAVFDFIRQSYLVTARWLQQTVHEVDGLAPSAARKIDFYTRQFVDAMAPSNFILTNPEVLRATLESGGENLVRGLTHMLQDLESGEGNLRIRMTDETAFELGRNLALTPGKVVFRNELIELLQYTPTTKEVFETPLLMVPAWINKYYILDLQAENSMIKWLVGQGHTVFVVSWVNPDEKLGKKSFDDYMTEGPLAALDAVEKLTGTAKTNIVGYCLGGTLLSITLAWLTAKGKADRVASVTYLTTMIDFAEAGELSVFIDEEQLGAMESRMAEKGYLEGRDMAMTFNMLRANDLIWSFVVNNYLLGKDPFPFDLLYWNADSTRMPAAMHSFYLRNFYQNNLLKDPGGVRIGGVPIDLRTVKTPAMFLSAREDHIAPWKSTYAATQIFKGPVEFVLAASGHIAGMINPPSKNKYCYWTNNKLPPSPDAWLKDAKETPGSWWSHWHEWLGTYAGKKIPARAIIKAIGEAPGEYVKVKD